MPDERRPMPPGEPGDEPDEAMGPGADRFERYLDALLGGERPSPDDVVDRDEAEMARLAAELSAAADPDEGKPDPAFLDQLRLRMRQADEGIATVQEPLPLRPTGAARGRVTHHAAPAAAGRDDRRGGRGRRRGRHRPADARSGRTATHLGRRRRPVGPRRRVGRRSPRSATCRSARRCASARRPSTATSSTTTARSARSSSVCTHMGCTLAVPAGLERPALPVPRRQLRPDAAQLANGRDGWRAEGGYRRRRHGLSDRAARPGQARRSRSTAIASWSGRRSRRPRPSRRSSPAAGRR